jgi:DNA-binding HxlR family transcriptional regulator
MRRKSFADMECPVAHALEAVGEWWTLLVIRDAFRGARRFEEFRATSGIARNILARRLVALVAAGILEKRPYQARPPRHEYRLTDKGRALFPVIVALMAWGARFGDWPDGVPSRLVARDTGAPVEPILADARTGRALGPRDVRLDPAPVYDR